MKKSLHPFHIIQEVFELLPDPVLVVDRNGKIMFYNSRLGDMLGYNSVELLAQPVDVIVPERFRERHTSYVAEFFKRKEPRKMSAGRHLYASRKDGAEVQVDIALSPYEVYGTMYSIAVIRELSDKHYLEEKIDTLRRTKEELERFAWVVSHDLKAPIKRVQILVDLILREVPQPVTENLSVLSRYLNQSVGLTEKLISGILEQARSQHNRKSDVLDLESILREVTGGIEVPPHFVIAVQNRLPSLRGNRTEWIQIFLNLLTNAIKYNDKEQGILEIEVSSVAGSFRFSFRDNGTVVPEEHRQSIFQMFYRTTDETSHGIGLSIVKKIVESNGGRIEYAESKLGGSEFVLYWPNHQP